VARPRVVLPDLRDVVLAGGGGGEKRRKEKGRINKREKGEGYMHSGFSKAGLAT
jgi:hypothetical protein